MKQLPEGKGPGLPPVEFTQAPIYEIDPNRLLAALGNSGMEGEQSGTAIMARIEYREHGKSLLFSKRGRAELERRGITEAQLDALRAEMKRDEGPEV